MAKESKNKKHFFKDFKAELKKVIWPTPKQLINSTIAVIVIVLITSAIVFVLDLAFDGMNKYLLDPAKASIIEKTTSNVVEETETTEGENSETVEEANEVVEENE